MDARTLSDGQYWLKAGTVIKLDGIPLELVEDTLIFTKTPPFKVERTGQ